MFFIPSFFFFFFHLFLYLYAFIHANGTDNWSSTRKEKAARSKYLFYIIMHVTLRRLKIRWSLNEITRKYIVFGSLETCYPLMGSAGKEVIRVNTLYRIICIESCDKSITHGDVCINNSNDNSNNNSSRHAFSISIIKTSEEGYHRTPFSLTDLLTLVRCVMPSGLVPSFFYLFYRTGIRSQLDSYPPIRWLIFFYLHSILIKFVLCEQLWSVKESINVKIENKILWNIVSHNKRL